MFMYQCMCLSCTWWTSNYGSHSNAAGCFSILLGIYFSTSIFSTVQTFTLFSSLPIVIFTTSVFAPNNCSNNLMVFFLAYFFSDHVFCLITYAQKSLNLK